MSEGRLLYRPAEAAESLSISRAKIYQLMARGELGSVKIAASRRIPAIELQEYVDRLRALQREGDEVARRSLDMVAS